MVIIPIFLVSPPSLPPSLPHEVRIPVIYGGEHGPDIDAVAASTGLGSAAAVEALHSGGDYRVYFLGFMGGFPYLGGG